jgi:hypothetical protein
LLVDVTVAARRTRAGKAVERNITGDATQLRAGGCYSRAMLANLV